MTRVSPNKGQRAGAILDLEYSPQTPPHACAVQPRIQAPTVKVDPSEVANDCAAMNHLKGGGLSDTGIVKALAMYYFDRAVVPLAGCSFPFKKFTEAFQENRTGVSYQISC